MNNHKRCRGVTFRLTNYIIMYVYTYLQQGSYSGGDAFFQQRAHLLWKHLQHLQLVLACEGCPLIASGDGFPCWLLLLPDLETNSTRSDGLFQLPQVVSFLPLMLSARVVPAVCIQDEVLEQHIPHAQHQMELNNNNIIQLNVEQ